MISEVIVTPSGAYSFVIIKENVDYKIRQMLMDHIGINIGGYKHILDSSSIKHVYNKHLYDSVPITLDDFWKIPDIIRNADAIMYAGQNRKGLDVIKYLKKYNNAQIAYLEEIRNGRHQLAMDTMYWVRKNK